MVTMLDLWLMRQEKWSNADEAGGLFWSLGVLLLQHHVADTFQANRRMWHFIIQHMRKVCWEELSSQEGHSHQRTRIGKLNVIFKFPQFKKQ